VGFAKAALATETQENLKSFIAQGKISFDAQKLADNINAFIHQIQIMKPHSVKGPSASGALKGSDLMDLASRLTADGKR